MSTVKHHFLHESAMKHDGALERGVSVQIKYFAVPDITLEKHSVECRIGIITLSFILQSQFHIKSKV